MLCLSELRGFVARGMPCGNNGIHDGSEPLSPQTGNTGDSTPNHPQRMAVVLSIQPVKCGDAQTKNPPHLFPLALEGKGGQWNI